MPFPPVRSRARSLVRLKLLAIFLIISAKDPDVKKAKGKQQSRVSIRSRRMGPSFSRQSDNSVPMKPPMDAR